MANINRNILLAALPVVAESLVRGGELLMSGFLEEDVPVLVRAAEDRGLRLVAVRSREEWRMIRMKK